MAKKKNRYLDQIVNELIKESIFSALFFSVGIDVLRQTIDQCDNLEVQDKFGNLFSAQSIRTQIRLMHEKLFSENS